ncbi:hypothetical protein [Marinobacterium aestuariivivens]|uniref:DUF7939 domain-containing protein n=1 Tax=Marinobacterium aestuariivivens TaxID=1698799 RepID=A0ABW1ZVG6_9GAMM
MGPGRKPGTQCQPARTGAGGTDRRDSPRYRPRSAALLALEPTRLEPGLQQALDNSRLLIGLLTFTSLVSSLGWLYTFNHLRLMRRESRQQAQEEEMRRRRKLLMAHQMAEKNTFQALAMACQQNNPEVAKLRLIEWAQNFWPDQQIFSGEDISDAARSQALDFLILDLEQHLYQGTPRSGTATCCSRPSRNCASAAPRAPRRCRCRNSTTPPDDEVPLHDEKSRRRLIHTLGLGGVAPDENPTARRWGTWFEWPMILAALWILVDWYLASQKGLPSTYSRFTDPLVWSCFLLELVLMTILVDDKLGHLRRNWLNLVIVLAGLPILWGPKSTMPAPCAR